MWDFNLYFEKATRDLSRFYHETPAVTKALDLARQCHEGQAVDHQDVVAAIEAVRDEIQLDDRFMILVAVTNLLTAAHHEHDRDTNVFDQAVGTVQEMLPERK